MNVEIKLEDEGSCKGCKVLQRGRCNWYLDKKKQRYQYICALGYFPKHKYQMAYPTRPKRCKEANGL